MIARTHDVARIGRVMIAMTGVLAIAAWVAWGPGAALSAIGGGVVAIANFYLIRTAVSRLIAAPRRPTVGVIAVLLKLLLTVALVAAAFARLPLEPLPFALGVSVLFGAVLVEGLALGTPIDANARAGDRHE